MTTISSQFLEGIEIITTVDSRQSKTCREGHRLLRDSLRDFSEYEIVRDVRRMSEHKVGRFTRYLLPYAIRYLSK